MSKFFRKQFKNERLPERSNVPQNDEYGRAEKGIAVCRRCNNVLYEKEWHDPSNIKKDKKQTLKKNGKNIRMTLCPACTMEVEGLYEGELVVKEVPERFEEELLRLIDRFSARAQERDPQDRIIHIEYPPHGLRVTTTENQLVVKLGKKIRDVFNKVDVRISYAEEPYEVNRVEVRFRDED